MEHLTHGLQGLRSYDGNETKTHPINENSTTIITKKGGIYTETWGTYELCDKCGGFVRQISGYRYLTVKDCTCSSDNTVDIRSRIIPLLDEWNKTWLKLDVIKDEIIRISGLKIQ
jgi:hypothetical protein